MAEQKKILFVGEKMSKVKAIAIVIALGVVCFSIGYFLPLHFWLMVAAVISGMFIYHWIDNFFKAVNADLDKDQQIHDPSESETTAFYESLEQRLEEENKRKK